MVIDAANGVEAQTRRLIEVCRQRDTPIITFVNKMDREVRDPLDILDEVERELGMPCCPIDLARRPGQIFGGIINLRTQMTVFRPAATGARRTRRSAGLEADGCARSATFDDAPRAWNWLSAPRPLDHGKSSGRPSRRRVLRLRRQQLRRAWKCSTPWSTCRPAAPHAPEVNRQPEEKTIQPEDRVFGVVFKVQANMDANHRDRIAFVRVASGKYTPA